MSETMEAVIIDANDKEIDSYDPVYPDEMTETDTHWVVVVNYNRYEVEKAPGLRLVVRAMEGE